MGCYMCGSMQRMSCVHTHYQVVGFVSKYNLYKHIFSTFYIYIYFFIYSLTRYGYGFIYIYTLLYIHMCEAFWLASRGTFEQYLNPTLKH